MIWQNGNACGMAMNNVKNNRIHIVAMVALFFSFSGLLSAQTWKFIKEKNGVQLYTCQEAGKGLKLWKGVSEIKLPAEKIYAKLENVNQTDWWTKDVTQFDVLCYKKDKLAQCYIVYRLPWPFKNRDLCVNITATVSPLSGERKLITVPLSGVCPVNHNCVRIKDYREQWKVVPIDKNRSRVELEFYIDPGTNLPDWLVNMVLRDSPIRIINAMRQYLHK
jgi:hypothetical protein